MKKAIHILSLSFLGIAGIAFFAPEARAANSPIIVVGQGQLGSTSVVPSGDTVQWNLYIGNGYSGPIEEIVVAGYGKFDDDTGDEIQVTVSAYPDDQYDPMDAIPTSHCQVSSRSLPMGFDFTDGTPFPLDFFLSVPESCQMQAEYYYQIQVIFDNPGDGTFVGNSLTQSGKSVNDRGWTVVHGGVSSSLGLPYFALLGPGWSLTPTEEDSGILLSGAFEFCNNAFASSTGIGATIGNGFCVALGYLFIPTQASVAQFGNFSDTLASVIPFSYFYDVSDIITGSTASTSANFSAMTINLRATGVASTTSFSTVLPASFGFLSTTTIRQYVPDTLYDLLFLLMRSAIWIAVLFHLYRRIVPHHATTV